MAVRYYDDAIVAKLKKWVPEESNLRILKPDESQRLFSLHADDKKDTKLTLPLVALSRDKDIELLSNVKQSRSFDGITYITTPEATAKINVIPILVRYQLDIYTKTYEEGDEYVRNFLFKLINNPSLYITIPYNNVPSLKHIANIRVLSTVSDTSDINQRIFSGQFTRWTIQMELQDAYLFSVPYKTNWRFGDIEISAGNKAEHVIGVELATNTKLSNPLKTDTVENIVLQDDK